MSITEQIDYLIEYCGDSRSAVAYLLGYYGDSVVKSLLAHETRMREKEKQKTA